MRRLLFSPLFLLTVAASSSNSLTPLIPQQFREDFSPDVNISSSGELVGLVEGVVAGPADPDAVRIPLGSITAPAHLCLSSQTEDGQYWARTATNVPPGASGLGYIDRKSQFRAQLAQYKRDSFAVAVRYGADCDVNAKAPFIPITYGGNSQDLMAAINASDALSVEAKISVPGQLDIPGMCEAADPDNRTIAFNVVCRFHLNQLAKHGTEIATLHLVLDLRTGPDKRQFQIVLP